VSHIKTVAASAFEAGDWSSLMVDPNSGQAIQPTPCTAASISPLPGAYPAGVFVSVSASAAGCPSPEFEFWVRPSGGTWSLARTYGTGATFSWNTAALG